jgi:hypothetical protein
MEFMIKQNIRVFPFLSFWATSTSTSMKGFFFLPNLLKASKSYMLKMERKTFVVRSLFLVVLGMWEDGYGINGMHSILDERYVVWNENAHE